MIAGVYCNDRYQVKEHYGISYLIEIPEDPIIAINHEGRSNVSNPYGLFAEQGLYRWAAGGVLHILNHEGRDYIPLILRDIDAPGYPGHYTIPSGLSDNYADLFNPTKVALKEGFEEIAVLVNGQLQMPGCHLFNGRYEHLFWEIFSYQQLRLNQFGINTDLQYTIAQALPPGNNVTICCGPRESMHYCNLLFVDHQARSIDFILMVKSLLPDGELALVDCEKTKTGFLDRTIYLIEADNYSTGRNYFASKTFKGGKFAGEKMFGAYPTVPLAEQALFLYKIITLID